MQFRASDGSCGPFVSAGYATRSRRLQCPIPYTEWDDDHQACVRPDVVAYLTGPVQPDECSRGNPCDVQTGAKSQPELDFDLGWVSFVRTFRSSQVARQSNFGPGWSHSHELRLSVSGDHALLSEGGGLQRPFRRVGAVYVAADASGDRIKTETGGGWTLSAADRTVAFDAQGRIARTTREDGTFLDYAYDAADRLEHITHSTGRRLDFLYDGTTRHAPMDAIQLDGVQLVSYGYLSDIEGQISYVGLGSGQYRDYHYEDERYPYFLTGVTDERGIRYSWFEYDDDRRVVASYHDGGADGVTLAYGAAQTVVTDALGAQTTYDLTPQTAGLPKVGAVTDAAGTVTREYAAAAVDFRRRLVRSVDRADVETLHTYTEAVDDGLPVSVHTIREAAGLASERTVVVRTATDSNRLVSVEQGDRRVDVVRNARGQPLSVSTTDLVSSQVRTTTYGYCEAADVAAPGSTCPQLGLLKTVDGPRTDVADTRSFSYHPADDSGCATPTGACDFRKGDLWKVTNGLGQVQEILAYDPAGRVRATQDANGVVTAYGYTPRGWLAGVQVWGETEADDRTTLIDYLPSGQVSRITPPDGAWIEYDYDDAQRLVAVRDSAGNSLQYTLDLAGNRLAEESRDSGDALKRSLSRVYNQLGQLATQADAGANPTDFTYDANGNLETVTDALSRVTQNDYDPLNRLIGTLQDVGGIEASTAFEYDALDNLTKVTDPKGLDTVYSYNGLGDLTQLDSPDTGVTTYQYDAAGNRSSQTDARGETTGYGYDALNRLTSVSYSDSSLDVAYAYDSVQPGCAAGETFAIGRLSRISDGSGHTDYCYDRFGQLVRKVQVTNGQSFTLRYAYTQAGQLRLMTYPDGTEVDYVRDGQGRTSEIGVTAPGGSREVLLSNASWYPFGPVGAWTFGNGRTLSRTLDLDYRPQSILSTDTASPTSGGGLDLGFRFDAVGNLTSLHGADRAEPPRVRLDYDALSRLTAFRDGPTGTAIESYGYDATGNRTSFTNAGGTQAYSYPTDSHRLGAVAGVARGYDAVGNTTAIGGTKEYVYSAANRLSAVKQGGAVTMHYGYNGRGERVHRHLGSDVTYSVYDEAGHWVGDYDASGAPKQQAIWLDDLPVGLLNGATTASNRLHYIEPDHLGTPRAVIEPQRDVAVWTWDIASEAFGNSAPNPDPDGDSTAFALDMRFPGQRYDAASGLNYNYFRDYEAGVGRYSQPDPIGLLGGLSTYSYVGGEPTSYIDPLGLQHQVHMPRVGPINAAQANRIVSYGTSPQYQAAVQAGIPVESPMPCQFCNDVDRLTEKYIKVWSYAAITACPVSLEAAAAGWFGRMFGARLAVTFPRAAGQIKHIFRNKVGHLPDTPANRRLLSGVASNPANRIGIDRFGSVWSSFIRSDGTQVWVSTRNGVIQNGGVNQVPKSFPNIVEP
ncbi:RHS repeat-associated core domain-containing protein [Marilutibacter maris]|uniref:Type IV secretion protein Rhs n=1 Tax=Marilutibacter maris TaxID=1605891 RepID=A0A2U9SZZ9_9GAMM|nr:RHS repeat-associated core domain-containing protein [Lysobacter maris]AWV05743.1 type IV secretion protein Rhs [Lysobacter maris]